MNLENLSFFDVWDVYSQVNIPTGLIYQGVGWLVMMLAGALLAMSAVDTQNDKEIALMRKDIETIRHVEISNIQKKLADDLEAIRESDRQAKIAVQEHVNSAGEMLSKIRQELMELKLDHAKAHAEHHRPESSPRAR